MVNIHGLEWWLGYGAPIEEIPKIDFPVLTRIRGLFIGPERTVRAAVGPFAGVKEPAARTLRANNNP